MLRNCRQRRMLAVAVGIVAPVTAIIRRDCSSSSNNKKVQERTLVLVQRAEATTRTSCRPGSRRKACLVNYLEGIAGSRDIRSKVGIRNRVAMAEGGTRPKGTANPGMVEDILSRDIRRRGMVDIRRKGTEGINSRRSSTMGLEPRVGRL